MSPVRGIHRLPAIVLLLVLAVLPLQAWIRASRPDVRFFQPVDGLAGITLAATVAPDGRLSVRIDYEFDDDVVRDVRVWTPSGSRFVHLDGEPTGATLGRDVETQAHRSLTVTYERIGAVTRYPDGVIVDFAGIENSDQAMFPCARCYMGIEGWGHTSIVGALFADDLTDARVALSGTEQVRREDRDDAVRFVGVVTGADSVGMVAWLPLDAAPDAPTVSSVPDAPVGETAAQVWEAIRAASDEPMREAGGGTPIGRVFAATILTAMWLALVVWIAWRLLAAKRALAADAPDEPIVRDAAFSPPSRLEPALVATVVGDTGPGERSAVAATLLSLHHRNVISIAGIDSERFTLTIPPGARGSTPFDEAVLAELRPQGRVDSTATLTGPPLWGPSGAAAGRRLARLAFKEAKQQRLLRVTLTAWVLIPASIAMGVVALIASGGSSWLAWLVTFAGPVVAWLAMVLTGTSLTAKGRAEREMWLDYADWLRTNSQLHTVGAPGVATWGEPLIYATVLGAAPKAAAALGTG